MEAAGLAVGVAALFSSCVQVFDIVLSAKDCSREYEELSALLAILRLRFELWGNGVGIPSGSIDDDDQIIPYNTNLDKPRVRPVIHRALENIQHLLEDVAAVDGRYGITVTTSDEERTTLRSFRIFQPRFDRLKERIRKGQKEKSIAKATRWALHDGKKFEDIVHRLTEFIENLNKVTRELGLYQNHLDELRIHAEIRNLSNEEDLEILVEATSKHSASSIHRSISDAASRRLSVVTSIFGDTRTQQRSTASTSSFYTAKTKPSEYVLDTVEEGDGEPSGSNGTRVTSTRSCAECAETGEACRVVDGLDVCMSCDKHRKQCSFDVGNQPTLETRSVSADSELQSTSMASTPQHERLYAEFTSRSRATPVALNFEAGDEHHGDHISAIQDADFDYWVDHVAKLALQAHRSTSTAKRMWYELRTINKANVPFISATPIAGDLGRILASIEGPPNTPYEGGVFWIVVLASKKIPPEAPTIRFHTKIYHPNIDHRTGKLCADYQQKWHQSKLSDPTMKGRISENPVTWSQRTTEDQWTLLSLLIAICALLASPNARDPLIPEIAQKCVEDPKGYHEAAQLWTKRYANSLQKPDVALLFPGESSGYESEPILDPSLEENSRYMLSKNSTESQSYWRWKYDERYISNAIHCVLDLLALPTRQVRIQEAQCDIEKVENESHIPTTRDKDAVNLPDTKKVLDHFFVQDALQKHPRQMTGDLFSDLEQWRMTREIRSEFEKSLFTNSTGCMDLIPKSMLLHRSRIGDLIKESITRLTDTIDQQKYLKTLVASFGERTDSFSIGIVDFDTKFPSDPLYPYDLQDAIPPTGRRRPEPQNPQNRQPSTPKKPPKPKATEADARKHRIPPGYSLKNWDPSEEPIMLLGSVFDANSLGKWIYDWTVYHLGPATPIADMAGEFWLLLIQLAGKIARAEECIPRIREEENRELVEDFIESGERLTEKLKKILKSCETPMLKAPKKYGEENLGKNAGTEFIDSIFGRDRQLEQTEKFMSSLRLWNLRFDANCEVILRNLGIGHPAGGKTVSTGSDLALPMTAPIASGSGEETPTRQAKESEILVAQVTSPIPSSKAFSGEQGAPETVEDTNLTSHNSVPNILAADLQRGDMPNDTRETELVADGANPATSQDQRPQSEEYDDVVLAPVTIRSAFGLETILEGTREPKYNVRQTPSRRSRYTASQDFDYPSSSSRSYHSSPRYNTNGYPHENSYLKHPASPRYNTDSYSPSYAQRSSWSSPRYTSPMRSSYSYSKASSSRYGSSWKEDRSVNYEFVDYEVDGIHYQVPARTKPTYRSKQFANGHHQD